MLDPSSALPERQKSASEQAGANTGWQTPKEGGSTPATPRSAAAAATHAMQMELMTPIRGVSSFLLAAPTTSQPLPSATTSATSAPLVPSSSPPSTTTGFSYFIQRMEYQLCVILRTCLMYLLESDQQADDTGNHDTMRHILFNHRIKHTNLHTATPILSGYQMKAGVSAMSHMPMMDQQPLGVSSLAWIHQVFAGLGIGLEEELAMAQHPHSLEAEFQ